MNQSDLRVKKMGTDLTKGTGNISRLETSVNGTGMDVQQSMDRMTGSQMVSQDYGSVMSPNSPLKVGGRGNLMLNKTAQKQRHNN